MSQTIEQERAKYAHHFITGQNSEENQDKLLTLIRKTPTMIIQNGLGQTLAFLLADAEGKTEKPSYLLYEFIQTWLCDTNCPCKVYSEGNLIERLIHGSRTEYIRAQQEVLMLFNWTKKFADAWLQGDLNDTTV